MATKQQLHDLIERLPENEIATVYRLLAGLLADPLWIASVTAPIDDEPYTPEQQADDAEAQAAIDRAEGIPHAQMLREFGLK
jgi:surfactin synthase thioesterase subunit